MEKGTLFQFSMDNALEIIFTFDDSGQVVYANKAAKEQLEYGDELCGLSVTEIFPEEIEMEQGKPVCREDEENGFYHLMAYRQNRTCFSAKVKILEFEEEGKITYICSAYNTTTENFLEKKASQAGQEAEDALKVKTEFVANITHELRTPVNGILGNTRELLELETEKEKLKLLHLVERGCNDMHSIINNILDFSKLDAGKFVLEPRKFHFRNMVDYVKGNHSNRITEKGLNFSVTVSPEIPEFIISDELRIVQVLNNLISNAYKFTSVGNIHVEIVKTAQSGNRAELFFLVMDTGIGISKANQEKLFQSFTQVDASISRKYGGTGLGLNICKQLVELMGGSIQVESEMGKGTVFSFHIWVEIPKEYEEEQDFVKDTDELKNKLQSLNKDGEGEAVWKYGTPENTAELENKMSKLILCLEMENWEKAEMFADAVRQLLEEAPREIKSAFLRLKMAVQKGDYEKATAAFEVLQGML